MDREQKTEVRTYKAEIVCKNCDGTMTPTGKILLSYPAKHEHKCTKCEYIENFGDAYPKIVFE